MLKLKLQILWPPDEKSWLIWKDPDAGKDWRQEEKGSTEDEMVGWHHRLNGRVWACSGSWWWTGKPGELRSVGSQRVGHDWRTERLNWTERSPHVMQVSFSLLLSRINCWRLWWCPAWVTWWWRGMQKSAGPAACTALAFCLTFAPSPEAPDAPVLEPFGDYEGLALYLNPTYLGVIFLRVWIFHMLSNV